MGENTKIEDLDDFEQRHVKFLVDSGHSFEKALEIYVNSADLDVSQLSPKLAAFAKEKGWIPHKQTAQQVKTNILQRIDEAVNDIQHLLETACCNDCEACQYRYLCTNEV